MLLGASLLSIGRNREKIRSPTWLKVEKVQNLEICALSPPTEDVFIKSQLPENLNTKLQLPK